MPGYSIDTLEVGTSESLAKTITDADIVLFAGISCDTNPVHVDDEYAAGTRFGGRIAHGMLSASLISAAIANKLPGPGTIYLGQSLRFLAPVRPGDTVKATVTVKEINSEKRRATLSTVCTVEGVAVIEGEAQVLVPAASSGEKR